MKIVAVSGMMGTGKTTLCDALARRTEWSVVREEPDKNVFLPLFYKDMERWALASQLTFMNHKTLEFEHLARGQKEVLLVDRTIQEDLLVFGEVLRKYDILSKEEYLLLKQMFDHLILKWAPIDLTIYLEDSDENCYQRLLSRGNAYESKTEPGYVRKVGSEYRRWRDASLATPNLQYNSATIDFRKPENIDVVLSDIKNALAGPTI
jgi:deoxyadenosine/deoxycytidine kinase